MKKLSLLAVALVSVTLLSTSIVSAVEYGGVGGRPANPRSDNPRTQSIFVYTARGGETINDGVRVVNDTDKTRTVAVGAVDSILSSGGAFSCRQEVEQKSDVGSWVKLSSKQVEVPAQNSVIVPFVLTVPKDASPGEHDGCITIQDASMTTTPTGTNGVVLGFRSGIRISLTIPGKIVKHLSLTGVEVNGPTNGNYVISPSLKNDGNVSLDALVKTQLSSLFGNAASSAEGTYPVLPHSTATLNFEVNRPFWGGLYHAKAVAKYNSNVKAELGSTKATDKTVSLASGYVWVSPSPWAVVIYVVCLALIAAAAYYLYRRTHHARHVRTHWRTYRVAEGDSIKQLADRFGVSWKRLATANKLKAPYDLRTGEIIKVPPKSKE
jgi:hypothetical protein